LLWLQDKDGMYGIDPGCVDSDMLRVIESAGDNPAKRLAVIEESAGNPRSLIGYQVRHRSYDGLTLALCDD
jgi:rRNA maturation protein Rpf1